MCFQILDCALCVIRDNADQRGILYQNPVNFLHPHAEKQRSGESEHIPICHERQKRSAAGNPQRPLIELSKKDYFLKDSSTATATATVAPTIGLLPMPMRPIISTCAGTEEEPANCASECMRPIVSVMP